MSWLHVLQHWIAVHSGTDAPGDVYYNWWSGPGSDLGELSILAAVVGTYRHHNCHVKGCFRLGRALDGTPYVACPKHHPDHTPHKGNRRSVTIDELLSSRKGST